MARHVGKESHGGLGTVRFVRASCRRCGAHLTAELFRDRLSGHCSNCGSSAVELMADAPLQERAAVSVFIVDDHPMIRHGLEQVLHARGHRVAGLACDGATALEGIAAQAPDVAIVDLELPDIGGLELLRRLRSERPAMKLVVYTATVRPSVLAGALAAGAEGLVSKAASVSRLAEAVEAVSRGENYVDEPLREIVDAAAGRAPLSRREREVLKRAARGDKLETIAERLFISPETARTHLRNARGKLGARTVAEAVAAALASGEIENGDED
jgi:DNA-binding NarL/FixJ family response regulator